MVCSLLPQTLSDLSSLSSLMLRNRSLIVSPLKISISGLSASVFVPISSIYFLLRYSSSQNFPSQRVRSSLRLNANRLREIIITGSQNASKGRGQQLRVLTTHQRTDPLKYDTMADMQQMWVLRDLSKRQRKETKSPGKEMVVMEIQAHLVLNMGVMRGIWNSQGLLTWKSIEELKDSLNTRATTTQPAEQSTSITTQAISAILKEMSLNTLMMLTTMHIEMKSETIQFLLVSHQAKATGILSSTPMISTILMDNRERQNLWRMKSVLREEQSISMRAMETQAMVEIQLTTSMMVVVMPGRKMLISPINRTDNETTRIHQMLKVRPPPSKELNREKRVDSDRMMVEIVMMMSMPHCS